MKKITDTFYGRLFAAIAVACAAAHSVALAQGSPLTASPSAAEVIKMVDEIRSSSSEELQMRAAAVGNLLLRDGRYRESAELFGALTERRPNDADSIYRYALATFNSGKTAEAGGLARRAVTVAASAPEKVRAQRSADALVLLAVTLAVEKRDKEALKALQDAVTLAPNHFDAQLALGRLLFGMGDDHGAIKAFSKAVGLQPTNSQALFFLATTFERTADVEKALAAYRKLVVLKPESYEGHLGLGAMLLKRGGAGVEEGLSELKLALRINPNLYEARIAVGRALIGKARPLEAIEHLQRAAELAPNNPEPHYQLSIAYRRLGQKEEASTEAAIVKRIHESRRSQRGPATP